MLQENLNADENGDGSEEEERDRKRSYVEEGDLSEQEEKEIQEAKKIRIEEGEISDEGLSRALRSPSSSSLSSLDPEVEVEAALSPLVKDDTLSNNDSEKLGTESTQLPRRIETGLFSQIPPELFFHILKFLSSEV